ncbi:unnamed protein product [Penicillium camemberti]|uniref:Str. FM013 n=1 Tax=Penicillium camemberti (strain FM 013) TaxID=1429867 RepID=A0A0G4PCW2_PENC3|nr:unnamed protein product [Penicillium camemberti]
MTPRFLPSYLPLRGKEKQSLESIGFSQARSYILVILTELKSTELLTSTAFVGTTRALVRQVWQRLSSRAATEQP